MKPTIDYLNARRACLPASGGKTYARTTRFAPDTDLDLWERTDAMVESAWSDYRINAEIMWQRIFDRFDLDRDDDNQSNEIPF